MTFHIYHANCIGDASNCSYPHADTITDAASLTAAVRSDYVCAEYKNHYRSNENFIGSDCLPLHPGSLETPFRPKMTECHQFLLSVDQS